MVPFQLVLAVVLVSGVWCFSETLDDGVEIGEPMHFFPLQYKKVVFVCPVLYGRFPHEKDCSLFYECRMGHLQLMKCNRDKLYDAKRQQCDDKRRVNCHRNQKDKNDKDHDKDKNKVIKTFRCPYPSGTFAHPDDCSRYFVCFLNVPSMLQCYGSNLFDEKSRKCLDKRRVKCGNRHDRDQLKTTKIPTQRPTTRPKDRTTTTEKPTTKKDTHRYRCPFPRGRYADPEDCSQYYDCHSGAATVHKCPRNKLYDERKEECSQDKNVKCGDRPGGVDGDKDEKDKIVIRCPYQWGIYPHPEDCSKYLICIYTVPTVYTCGKNELYHAKYRRCYPKDKVTCDYRINPDDLRQKSTTKSGRTTTFVTSTTTRVPSTTQTTVTETTTFETTITTEAETTTPVPTTTVETTTPVPTSTVETTITTEAETTTPVPTTTVETTTPVPTTTVETTITTEAETITTEAETTTPVPTTTVETTITTDAETTITTEAETTTPVPTTTVETTITTEAPTTIQTEDTTTPETTAITTVAEITTETPESTTVKLTTPPSTPSVPTTTPTTTKVTKPNTPPPTECEEDDLDCIIDGTGDVRGWFDCPERYGHFAHASSHQLFIHCDNWKPYVKTCADGTVFSPKYLVCMWLNQSGQKSFQ